MKINEFKETRSARNVYEVMWFYQFIFMRNWEFISVMQYKFTFSVSEKLYFITEL